MFHSIGSPRIRKQSPRFFFRPVGAPFDHLYSKRAIQNPILSLYIIVKSSRMPFDLTTSTNPPTKSDLFASDFKSSKKIRAHHQNAHLFLREETLEQFRERDPHGYSLSVFLF